VTDRQMAVLIGFLLVVVTLLAGYAVLFNPIGMH
jgi:hypothetical protein